MGRISGVDVPRDKRAVIALTYVYGIGKSASIKILERAKIDENTRMKDLTEDEISRIRSIVDKDYEVEGDLRRSTNMNVKRLMDIGSYRGLRHRKGCSSTASCCVPGPRFAWSSRRSSEASGFSTCGGPPTSSRQLWMQLVRGLFRE